MKDKYFDLINNLYLISLGLIILLIAINYLLVLVLFIIYLIFLYKNKIIFKTMIIISIIIIGRYLLIINEKALNDDKFSGHIQEISNDENRQRLLVTYKNNKVLVYDSSFYNVNVGDIIYIEGAIKDVASNHVEGGFDFKKYLRNNQINYCLDAIYIEKIDHINNLGAFRQKIINYFENTYSSYTLSFMKSLILGDSTLLEEEFQSSLRENGTIHLFAISGLHIIFFVSILNSLLVFFNIKRKDTIIYLFLIIYLIITNFSPSVFRASLMFILNNINKKYKLRFSSLDVLSITFIFLLVINPLYMYNLGFVLSFLVCLNILLLSPLISRRSNLESTFIISLSSLVITFPIIINTNYSINILSPIINILFIYVVSTIVLPLSIIVLFIPILQNIYNYVIISFSSLSVFISKNITLPLYFSHLNIFQILIYYGVLIIICTFFYNKTLRKVLIVILSGFLLLLSNKNVLNEYNEIVFLDLYNGDSIVINHQTCKAIVDTGEENSETLKYLQYKGMRDIDLLILTHNHSDHNGMAKDIINNLNVEKIIVSAYDNSIYSKQKNSIKVVTSDIINCGDVQFKVLSPDEQATDENDNSVVLDVYLDDYHLLLMGDAGINIEKNINTNDVDILKIGHHGSKTASSYDFLKRINPQMAIISTTRVKKFGFPNEEVINNLEELKIPIYRTDLNYTITFKYNKKESIIKTIK